MFYNDEGEIGKVKDVITKLHFSLIPAIEDYPKQSIEVYESQNFINDTTYDNEIPTEDFIGEYELLNYISFKDLIEEFNVKPCIINTILLEYNIVYTKSWTACGYEYDREHDIKNIKIQEHPKLVFSKEYQEIVPKDELELINLTKDTENIHDIKDNKDSKDTFKDVHRCDLNKPCVQYCSSDKTKCGVLVKRFLGESV